MAITILALGRGNLRSQEISEAKISDFSGIRAFELGQCARLLLGATHPADGHRTCRSGVRLGLVVVRREVAFDDSPGILPASIQEPDMADTSSSEDSQLFSTDISRRRVVAGAV